VEVKGGGFWWPDEWATMELVLGRSGWVRWCGDRFPKWMGLLCGGADDELPGLQGVCTSWIGLRLGW
jgi:hypothetical protein